MKYKLREICRGACGAMTIGNEYDIDTHGNFYDDNGGKCHQDYYKWSMPDSIYIAVSDGSKPNEPIHSRTPNQPDIPSNNATNGGYPHESNAKLSPFSEHLADLPTVTSETFTREPENSGGSCSYYDIELERGTDVVSCQDIIDNLEMTFNEGTALKSLWRKAAARQGKLKANNTALRDAEKIHHSATRILAEEQSNV